MAPRSIIDNLKSLLTENRNKGVGLDIADDTIKLLKLEKSSGKMGISFLAQRNLAKGQVEDGKILNRKEVKKKLSDIKEEADKKEVSLQNPVLSVPESKTFLHIFKIPSQSSEDDLKEAVKQKARTVIPFEPEEVYADYVSLPKKEGLKEVLYAACPKKIVDDYKAVASGAGINISVLDIEAISITRALIPPPAKEKRVLVCDCGKRTTTPTVFDRSRIEIFNSIPRGGEAFTEALAKKLGVSYNRAEVLKMQKGLASRKILVTLEPVLSSIYKQLEAKLERYKQDNGIAIKKIILAGESAFLAGFSDHMEQNLNVEVRKGRPFVDNELQTEGLQEAVLEKALSYTTVLGSAFRKTKKGISFPRLNLLS